MCTYNTSHGNFSVHQGIMNYMQYCDNVRVDDGRSEVAVYCGVEHLADTKTYLNSRDKSPDTIS